MILTLIGVVSDGSPRDLALVPSDTRRTVQMIVGATVQVVLSVFYPSGAPLDLTGYTTTLTLKRGPCAGPQLVKTMAPQAGSATNVVQATVASTDTAGWCAGRYIWDIWISKVGQRDNVVPLGAWIMQPTVGTT